jgi:hypothetical protein
LFFFVTDQTPRPCPKLIHEIYSRGHVVLFETVVPICPPACDGYNYSSLASQIAGSCLGLVLLMLAAATLLKKRRL